MIEIVQTTILNPRAPYSNFANCNLGDFGKSAPLWKIEGRSLFRNPHFLARLFLLHLSIICNLPLLSTDWQVLYAAQLGYL
jgi:hypothetical protein